MTAAGRLSSSRGVRDKVSKLASTSWAESVLFAAIFMSKGHTSILLDMCRYFRILFNALELNSCLDN